MEIYQGCVLDVTGNPNEPKICGSRLASFKPHSVIWSDQLTARFLFERENALWIAILSLSVNYHELTCGQKIVRCVNMA